MTQQGSTPYAPPPQKRLYRSRTHRMMGGVLGGFAEYAAMDPTVVRLVFVILTIFTGVLPGLIAYLVALLIVPEEPVAMTPAAPGIGGYPTSTPPPPPPP